MKKEIKLGIVTLLITLAVSILKLIQGWEIAAFAVLTYVLFYFSIFFVQYVDEQKNVESVRNAEENENFERKAS